MVSLLPLMLVALPRLVVPSMEGHNVADDLRASMTDALVAAVRRQAQDYDVLGGNEVQALLHVQAQKQQLACHDSSNVGCLVEIGGALGADRMVFGTLDRVGKSFFLDVKLIDVAHARVLSESSAPVGSEDDLLAAILKATGELFSAVPRAARLPAAVAPAPAPAPAAVTPPAPPPTDGLAIDASKVYSGPDGLEVDLAWLAPRSGKQALVRVTGGSSPFEGKVLLSTVQDDGGSLYFVTQYHGRDWATVVGEKHSWSDALVWEVRTPGMRDGLKITYDKAATEAFKADALLTQYRAQRDSGALTELARFDRKGEEQGIQTRLSESLAEASKACARALEVQIDWSSIDDPTLKKYSIDSYCAPPASAIRQRCEGDPAFKTITMLKIKKLTCRFGSALALSLDHGTLKFTTAIDAVNQDQWALNWVRALR